MTTVLVSVDTKRHICRRYEVARGVRRLTHEFEGALPVTAEEVADVRTRPEETGKPEPEAA